MARRELSRRLPGAEIVTYAPGEHVVPSCLDAGDPALPLGAWSEERLAELRTRLDCVVVTGATIGPASSPFLLEADCWHAVSVDESDETVAKAMAGRASVSLAGSLPHPAALASRLFPAALVEKRLAYLRLMGWLPGEGRPVLDDGMVETLMSVEDVVAAVAGSAGVVTASPALAAVALGYGVPHVMVDGTGDAFRQLPPLPPPADPDEVERAQQALDASYDAVAAVAREAPVGTSRREATLDEVLETLTLLRQAHAAQARRLVAERLVFADHTAELAERLRQAEEQLAAHGAVVAAQEGVIAGQRQALVEHQQAVIDLTASLETQTTELERARAVFDDLQAHIAALEARLAEEHAALEAIRASLPYRVQARFRRP